MESSAVLAEFQIEGTAAPQFMAHELDWENIIPKDLPEPQLVGLFITNYRDTALQAACRVCFVGGKGVILYGVMGVRFQQGPL